MLGEDLVDQAVRLLSTAIGMIMEDHAEEALSVTRAPAEAAAAAQRLTAVGHDIAALASAAAVLLSRR